MDLLGVITLIFVAFFVTSTFWPTIRRHFIIYKNIPRQDGNFLFSCIPRFLSKKKSLPDKPVTRIYWEFMKDEANYTRHQKHGCFWAGIVNPMVTTISWKTSKPILTSPDILGKSFQYNFLDSWLGSNLLTSGGHIWRGKRRLLSKGFTTRNIKAYIPLTKRHGERLVQSLRNRMSSDDHQGQVVVAGFHKEILQTTLGVIMDAFMGVDVDQDKSFYSKGLDGFAEVFMYRMVSPWTWFETLFKFMPTGRLAERHAHDLKHFTEEAIKTRHSDKEKVMTTIDEPTKNVILDMILDSFPADIARDEINTLIFAGHDTTGMAVFFTLFLLGHHQDVQERLFEEVQNMDMDSVDYDQIKTDFPYLDCVTKEAMRLFPSVPFVARLIPNDLHVPAPDGSPVSSYHLPAGSIAQIYVPGVHRDPEYFDNPEDFNPDRFMNGEPEAFIPFVVGPRSCIGMKFAVMEMKVLVSQIVKSFKIESLTEIEQLDITMELIMKVGPNVQIRFTNRK